MSEPIVSLLQRCFESSSARNVVTQHQGRAVHEPAMPATERGRTVRVARRYRAAAQRVFDAWVRPEIAVSWLFATATRPLACAEMDAQVGGRFRLVEASGPTADEWVGEYLAIEPHRRLVFTLSLEPEPASRVAVEIAEADRGCRLTLEHNGVARSIAKRIRERWIGILCGLDVTLRATARVTTPRSAGAGRIGARQG